MKRAVWQISAGPVTRTYADVFLKHGVALIGPGDAGPWTPGRDDDEFEGGFVLTNPPGRPLAEVLNDVGARAKKRGLTRKVLASLLLGSGAEERSRHKRRSQRAARPHPRDNKFLVLAVSGRATHIVSGDADLLSLNAVPEAGNLSISTLFIIMIN
jgi:hypothetical protein